MSEAVSRDSLESSLNDLRSQLLEEEKLRAILEERVRVLEKLVHLDPATGMRSAHYLRARLQEEVERSIRYPSAITLVTVCFPPEQAVELGVAGAALGASLRTTDHVFRFNQNSLAVLLLETGADGTQQAIERLVHELPSFVKQYGVSVTSFPVDTTIATDFLATVFDRHDKAQEELLEESSSRTDS